MDFILYMLDNAVRFAVSGVPILVTILLLKVFELRPRATGVVLCLMFLQSVFFWCIIKDVWLTVYQCVPYLSGVIIIWAESIRRKRDYPNDDETGAGGNRSGN